MAAFAAEKYQPCTGCGGWPQFMCDEVLDVVSLPVFADQPQEQWAVRCKAAVCLNCVQRVYGSPTYMGDALGAAVINLGDWLGHRCPQHRSEAEKRKRGAR